MNKQLNEHVFLAFNNQHAIKIVEIRKYLSCKKDVLDKDVIKTFNDILNKYIPPLVAVLGSDNNLLIYNLFTKNKHDRKCILTYNKKKFPACLIDGCVNIVNKYNYCQDHRDINYEKSFITKIYNQIPGQISQKNIDKKIKYCNINGKYYEHAFFMISPQHEQIALSHIWWLDVNYDIISNEGRFVDLICDVDTKAQLINNSLDFTVENLTFARKTPYQIYNTQRQVFEVMIPLYGHDGFGKEAMVDLSDFDKLKSMVWKLNKHGYATSNKKLMHRFIMDPPSDMVVDHLNRNRIDNRRCNLEIKTQKQNSANRTTNKHGFEGVVFDTDSRTYKTTYKGIDIFWHNDERMCALCYDSIKYYIIGQKAGLNDMSREPMTLDYWNLPSHILVKIDEFKYKHTNYHKVKHTKDGWITETTVKLGPFKTEDEAAMYHDILTSILSTGDELNFKNKKYSADQIANVMSMIFKK